MYLLRHSVNSQNNLADQNESFTEVFIELKDLILKYPDNRIIR